MIISITIILRNIAAPNLTIKNNIKIIIENQIEYFFVFPLIFYLKIFNYRNDRHRNIQIIKKNLC